MLVLENLEIKKKNYSKENKNRSPCNGHELVPAETGLSRLTCRRVFPDGFGLYCPLGAVAIYHDHWSNLPAPGAGLPDPGKRDVPHHLAGIRKYTG